MQRIGVSVDGVQLLVAVADGKGRLVRFFANSSYPHYLPYRIAPQGGIRLVKPAKDVRTLGSLGKVFAALLLGKAGDRPEDRYYRLRRERVVGRYPYQRREPFRNADGFTGVTSRNDPRAPITARDAFARSDNLALMERLARRPGLETDSTRLLAAFGLSPPKNFEPVTDLPLGRVHGAPRTVHGLFALLVDPIGEEPVCRPTLVLAVQPRLGREAAVRAVEAAFRADRKHACTRARAWLASAPGALGFTRAVLSGVLDPARRGTAARYLSRYRQEGPLKLPLSIAKTGTVSAGVAGGVRKVRWVWLAGALETPGGQRYSYVAHAGPVGTARDLGPHAGGGQLGALLLPVLETLPGLGDDDAVIPARAK